VHEKGGDSRPRRVDQSLADFGWVASLVVLVSGCAYSYCDLAKCDAFDGAPAASELCRISPNLLDGSARPARNG